jgi:hypothetical protein
MEAEEAEIEGKLEFSSTSVGLLKQIKEMIRKIRDGTRECIIDLECEGDNPFHR